MNRIFSFFVRLFSGPCTGAGFRARPEAGFFGISAGTALAIGAVAVAGASAYTASQNRIASNKANDLIAKNGLNISNVIDTARQNAADNLKASIALERQLQPGTAALRLTADAGLEDLASGHTAGLQARNALLEGISSPNPLLQASTDSILKQLQMGGKLDPETQAAVTKASLEAGGTAGISGSGAGRGLVARDLGLTSLSLLTSRQNAALTGGQALTSDLSTRYGIASNAAAQDANNSLNIASLIDKRAMPDSGISSGSLVDLLVGQNNAQNQNIANRAKIDVAGNNATNAAFAQLIGGLTSAYTGTPSTKAGYDTSANGSYNDMVAAMNSYGKGCWIAREVYGVHNPRWRMFRAWLFEDAPDWLRQSYLAHGEFVAEWLKGKSRTKNLIRLFMDSRIHAKFNAVPALA